MLNLLLIPTDPIEHPTQELVENRIRDKFGAPYSIDTFNHIELQTQSVSKFITYFIKNQSEIDGMLINPTQIITFKFKHRG